MSQDQSESRRLPDALDQYVAWTAKKGNSGNYRRNAKREIDNWIEWTQENRSVHTLDGLDVDDLAAYALFLKQRADDEEIKASTAGKYYDYVRAGLSWLEDQNVIETNPAAAERAVDLLPDDDRRDGHRQQVWSPEQRRTIVDYVGQRARAAADEKGMDAVTEFRDRAFVVTIGYSGARGGELVADRNDDRRNGIRWADVDLENGTVTVLGKDQEWTDASLPPQAVAAIDKYRTVVDPPTDEWPVFPTEHRPTLALAARNVLHAAGLDEDDIEGRLSQSSATDVLREEEVPPPALTTDGARDIMRRLTKEADVPGIDTQSGEYLELHGGRHGAGDTIVRELGWEAAQNLLRHNNPEVTMKTYSHIEASETAEAAGEAFDRVDRGSRRDE